jgi:C4-dicarboxylate-specific signal transduction histidine kinase
VTGLALSGSVAAAAAGWLAAAALLVVLRRRDARMADAEHELRGAASVIGLAVDRASRTGFTAAIASLVRLQIDRMGAALADLPGARSAPAARAEVDAGRLAQVLANLLANAAEHGDGPVQVTSSSRGRWLRLEIRNPGTGGRTDAGRGRGLAIAERAAHELGGRLEVTASEDETVATVELPAGDLPRAA